MHSKNISICHFTTWIPYHLKCLAHVNVSCVDKAGDFNTNNSDEDNRCQLYGTKPFEWNLSWCELQPQSCSVQCLLTMEDENWLMCWLPRSWGICYGSLTCMWHIEWKMVSLSVASGERWVASQTAVKSFSSWGYCDLLGQENTRIKIERPVLSPWLFCQHPSWPWLNHLPLLDVTTWWSWRWYLSAVCTSVLPGISPYIEPGQVYGCCFFSSSSSDLHSVLFVTLASEKKDQVHGPPFP